MQQQNSATEIATENKMGQAPIFKLILSMSLPSMFSMLVQALYNIVDSIFVAQVAKQALTAVTLAFPLQSLIISVAVGTGIGINSLVSRRLGEGKREEASLAATHGLFLGIICGAIFALIGIFATKPFFNAFTNDPTTIQMGSTYIYIVMICSFGVFLQINIEKTLQATGNMLYPMLFQLTGAIINIVLDPILIFGLLGFPKMGVAGAAIATVIGQLSAMIFSMIILHVKSHDVHMSLKGFRPRLQTIKEIYAVGFPSIIMQAIGSVLTTLVNGILIGFSDIAVNVFGAYFRIQSFIFMPVFGLTSGLMPIMGFNYGAKNRKRLVSALRIGVAIAAVIMAIGTILFMLIPDKLLMLFNPDEEMLRIGVVAFRVLSVLFIPAAIGITVSTFFQAIGSGAKSLIVSVLRQLAVLLPAAYLLSKLGNVNYVWAAFPLSEILAMIVSLFFLKLTFDKNINVYMPPEKTSHED